MPNSGWVFVESQEQPERSGFNLHSKPTLTMHSPVQPIIAPVVALRTALHPRVVVVSLVVVDVVVFNVVVVVVSLVVVVVGLFVVVLGVVVVPESQTRLNYNSFHCHVQVLNYICMNCTHKILFK